VKTLISLNKQKNILYYFLFVILFIYTIFILIEYQIESSLLKYSDTKLKQELVSGKVIFKKSLQNRDEYILETQSKTKYFLVDFNEEEYQIGIGDKIVVKAETKFIDLSNNYELFLYHSFNIVKNGFIKEFVEIKRNYTAFYKFLNCLFSITEDLKNNIIKLVKNNLPEPQSSIILRLSLGYKDSELSEVINYFQNAGVVHVLVVSGLHVGFVYIFVYFILKFLFLPKETRIVISILFILLFMLLTGCAPPVVRATIIIICFVISELLHRKQSGIHSLILSALILLLINPKNLFNPSFQLSFAACFGITYFYNIFNSTFENFINKTYFLIRYLFKLFLVTTSAQLTTLPFIMYYFNKISVIAFVSNLFIIPLTSVLLWISLIFYILSFIFGGINIILWDILKFLCDTYIYIVKFFAGLPFSVMNVTRPDSLNFIIYSVLVLSVPILLKKKLYKTSAFFVIFAIFSLNFNFEFNKNFKITFLNVSLGDSIFISTDDGKNILIDTGDSKETAMYKIVPYLKKIRIKRIDHLLITHPHYPHYGGAEYIIENFDVRKIYINSLIPKNNKEYKIFINNLKDKNTNLVVVNSTKTINLLNGKVEFIPNFVNLLDDEIRFFDDNSILVKITYKNFKIILSNDISFRYLKNFLDKSFFIIQIPRHGKYKEDFELIKEFLSKNPEVKVKFGIISTDFSNFYKLKFPVFSTENFGDIEINFKNKHLKINKIVGKSNGIVIEI